MHSEPRDLVVLPSPVGPLGIEAVDSSITRVVFRAPGPLTTGVFTGVIADAKRQLDEYFAGKRRRFELPLAPAGTSFQRAVWNALLQIPYGETVSYGQLPRQLGPPFAGGAAGGA